MLGQMFKKTKSVVRACDLFRTTQLIRYKDNPEYKSANGGICSIAIIIGFMIVFTQTILNTFDKKYISSQKHEYEETEPTYFSTQDKPFLFALGISGFNLNHPTLKYFNVQISQRAVINGVKSTKFFTLEPCSRSSWTSVDASLGAPFDSIGLANWLCLPSNITFEFTGKFTSNLFKYLKIAVKDCKMTSGDNRTCINSSLIDSYLATSGPISFNYYFVNTIINPDDAQYLSSYLQDRNYFTFTKSLGTSTNIFISNYIIKTDESLWPWSDQVQDQGGVVYEPAQRYTFNPNYIPNATQYISLFIRKSSLSLSIKRSFRKIDDTLSYIGGLISTLMLCLVFMAKYNQYSYEIQIASKIYKYKANKGIKSSQFNFIIFIKYFVYTVFEFFNLPRNWKNMKHYSKVKDLVGKQLDLKLLLRKISFFEECVSYLFEDYQLKCLHLKGKMTLAEAQNIRKKFQARKQLLKLKKKLEGQEAKQQKGGEQTKEINISNQQVFFEISNSIKDPEMRTIQLQNNNKDAKNNKNNKKDDDDKNDEYSQQSSLQQQQQQQKDALIQNYIQSIQRLKHQARRGNNRCEKIYNNLDRIIKEMPSLKIDRIRHQEFINDFINDFEESESNHRQEPKDNNQS